MGIYTYTFLSNYFVGDKTIILPSIFGSYDEVAYAANFG